MCCVCGRTTSEQARMVTDGQAHLCPCCKVGRLHATEMRIGAKRLPAPGSIGAVVPQAQGPP